ncbi:YhgE/Pip domain-containing protein [Lentilactobacillus buchneri]|uniref:YhgE/Pip domain-containing protein n=1 Tax=Lentilactobacillus buchneri TaxID=1581 RepID=UPI0002075BAF|nr:YhgE/Pip domain-containing protein [Lentilactobacillus buchneri]AEB74057.1 YhgE/Pip N-terminal domain protein [Lentilactobacillus buchneri NRRL B-30929]MQM83240.1 YhgE/Pip domain-containing protein [Lentilactobacillus buchneri]
MRTILTLLKRDLHNIFHSRPVWITLLAFCLIPAIYAVPNIMVSWDPYSKANTSRLPIAVVNDDEGSTVNGKQLNVGKQIVGELKQNHAINWIMTNDWQGNNGLDEGKYYSLIEIPNDFSSKLATLVSTNPEKPNIIYKSNEKLNPAATKITGQAVDTLTEQVRDSFIKISTKAALKEMNAAGAKINTHKPEILQIRSSLLDAINTVKKTNGYLDKANKDSDNVEQYLKTVQGDIPKISSQITDLQNVVNHGRNLTKATKQSLSSAQNDLSNGLNDLQSDNNRINSLVDDMQTGGHASSKSLLNSEINQLETLNESTLTGINNALRIADVLNNLLPNNQTTSLIRSLSNAKQHVHEQQRNLTSLKNANQDNRSQKSINQLIKQLAKTTDALGNSLTDAGSTFTNTVSQVIDDLNDTLDTQLNGNDEVLSSLRTLLPQLNALTSAGKAISKISVSQVNRIKHRLNGIEDKLNDLNDQTKFINEKNLNKIINLLGENPKISNLLASPITLKQKQLYNMGLFGYGMAPFYTVLSMWVGVLLLTTIVSWKYLIPEDKRFPKANRIQQYVGKGLLYLILSFTQTTFIMLGELVIIGLRPRSLLAMLATAYLATTVFTIIMFTLVYMFGNIGKVFSVLMMIAQLFGTGGVYPLELIPSHLASLAPFLPFTYVIQAFREAIAGPIPSVYWHAMLILAAFGGFFLLMAPLWRVFVKPLSKMENGFHKSQL